MENIGSGAGEQQLHGYNCDISLVAGGQTGTQVHRHPQGPHAHLPDREKSFSVTHLLELPGQGAGHLYHAPLHDPLVAEHHRLHQQLKLPEGLHVMLSLVSVGAFDNCEL